MLIGGLLFRCISITLTRITFTKHCCGINSSWSCSCWWDCKGICSYLQHLFIPWLVQGAWVNCLPRFLGDFSVLLRNSEHASQVWTIKPWHHRSKNGWCPWRCFVELSNVYDDCSIHVSCLMKCHPPTWPLKANRLSIEARKQDLHESTRHPWLIWSDFIGRPSVQLTSLGQLDFQVHCDGSRQGQVNWKECNWRGQWHTISLWNALLPTREIILKYGVHVKTQFQWAKSNFSAGSRARIFGGEPAIVGFLSVWSLACLTETASQHSSLQTRSQSTPSTSYEGGDSRGLSPTTCLGQPSIISPF